MVLGHIVKVTVPNYLSGLPIPDTFGGWFKLGFKDWLSLVPPAAAVAGFSYITYLAFCPHGRPKPDSIINPCISKDIPKVVNSFDIEDISEKVSFCRCWRSKNWPYCDGAHGKHNKETGDNIGPLVLKVNK